MRKQDAKGWRGLPSRHISPSEEWVDKILLHNRLQVRDVEPPVIRLVLDNESAVGTSGYNSEPVEVRRLLEVVLPWERWSAAAAIAWYEHQRRRKAARAGLAAADG